MCRFEPDFFMQNSHVSSTIAALFTKNPIGLLLNTFRHTSTQNEFEKDVEKLQGEANRLYEKYNSLTNHLQIYENTEITELASRIRDLESDIRETISETEEGMSSAICVFSILLFFAAQFLKGRK